MRTALFTPPVGFSRPVGAPRRRATVVGGGLAAAAGFVVLLGWAPRAARADEPVAPYEHTLRQKLIPADEAGLRKYLRDLHPNEDQRRVAAQWIGLLGSDVYSERETAMAKLLIMPTLPHQQLQLAAQGNDPEIRWRAKTILEIGGNESAVVLHAAMKAIALKKLAGLAPEVLAAHGLCDKNHLKTAARDALVATSRGEDVETLRGALAHSQPEARAAAVDALAATLGGEARADCLRLLDDPATHVAPRLAAARALANLGERRALAEFLNLMKHDDVLVRVESAVCLQNFTNLHFGYAAYDQPDRRAAALGKWQDWLAKDGASAKLHFPLKPWSGGSYLNGNTLLAFGYQNKVAEFDPSGKEIWTYTANGAWSAEKLSNGNVLIAAYNENRAIEVSLDGKIVWEFACPGVLNARPLRNGNYLLSAHSEQTVKEISRDKKLVWSYKTSGNTCDAVRLDNGNTLIAQGNSIVEVTPEGKVNWEYPSGQPYGVQALDNGNVLISDLNGKVVEVTRDKKIVWEFNDSNPVDAFRLPNGNTLVCGGARFVEVTPDKKIVWEKPGCNYGSARR